MFFSAQKNKCCSLDFHQDHNIYYRAEKRQEGKRNIKGPETQKGAVAR